MNTKKTLLLINTCITGLILWMASNIIVTWTSDQHGISPDRINRTKTASLTKTTSERIKKLKYYNTIIAYDIFKTTKDAPYKPARSKPEKKNLRLADLNLKLKGTVVGDNKDSYAIILDGNTKKENLFFLNDFIQWARIIRIMPDRVIFDLKGSQETLIMSDEISPAPATKKGKSRSTKRKRKRPRI